MRSDQTMAIELARPVPSARRRLRTCLMLSLTLAWITAPSLATAQARPDTLIVVGGPEPEPERAAEAARLEARGARLLSTLARERGCEPVAAPAQPPTPAAPERLVEALNQCIDGAIRAAAAGNREQAHREIGACQRLIADARPALLANDTTANQVFDACMVEVRLLADDPDAGMRDAIARARACRSAIPFAVPTRRRHTEEAVAALADADEAIQQRGGMLVIRHEGEARCEVKVNNRPAGLSPVFMRLDDGTYHVSGVCGGQPTPAQTVAVHGGRETTVHLWAAPAAPALPPSLRAEGGYITLRERTDGIVRFYPAAREAAAEVGVSNLLVLWLEPSGRRWAIHHFRPNGGEGSAGRVSVQRDDDAQREAFAQRLTQLDCRASEPAAPPPTRRQAGGLDPGLLVTGAALGALGLAGLSITLIDLGIASGEGHAIAEEGFFALWLITGAVGLGVGIPLFVVGLGEGGGSVSAELGPGSLRITGDF